jgi:two-component system OmpR family response regulator
MTTESTSAEATSAPRLLIACDQLEAICALTEFLEDKGFEVVQATMDSQTLLQCNGKLADLIIIDTSRGGLRMARQIRAISQVGIILIFQTDDPVDPVDGLELGADDVIQKPYRLKELLARVRSVIRRTHPPGAHASLAGAQRISFDGWILHTDERRLESHDGKRVSLTGAEYQLLMALLENPCRVLSRDQLFLLTKGRTWQPADRSLDVLVARLRRKLESATNRGEWIKSVRGAGYVFCIKQSDIYAAVT